MLQTFVRNNILDNKKALHTEKILNQQGCMYNFSILEHDHDYLFPQVLIVGKYMPSPEYGYTVHIHNPPTNTIHTKSELN